jgi:hypothetical protein
MKIPWIITIAVFSAALLLKAETLYEKARHDLPEPPSDAQAGVEHDGVQIGLWTQKATYSGDEIRNVWIFARKKGDSDISIGVGGNLFKESFIYITDKDEVVTKIPVGGGSDGPVDASYIGGGISDRLTKLPAGDYELVWKTDKFESNILKINIK